MVKGIERMQKTLAYIFHKYLIHVLLADEIDDQTDMSAHDGLH
jgi:hypothetical protein